MRATALRAILAAEPGPVRLPPVSSAGGLNSGSSPGVRSLVSTVIIGSEAVGNVKCYYP